MYGSYGSGPAALDMDAAFGSGVYLWAFDLCFILAPASEGVFHLHDYRGRNAGLNCLCAAHTTGKQFPTRADSLQCSLAGLPNSLSQALSPWKD